MPKPGIRNRLALQKVHSVVNLGFGKKLITNRNFDETDDRFNIKINTDHLNIDPIPCML